MTKDDGVRRLPVIDGHDLVGIISQADVAVNLPEGRVADLVRGDQRRSLAQFAVPSG